ncbi:hypothetical protein HD554DRAFT_2038387 [Boletus coccyginus]|nr:hypothetical protein HD554DRAFT_2038387 [Boletus coccyginus]
MFFLLCILLCCSIVQLVLELQNWMADRRTPIVVKIQIGSHVFETWAYISQWIHAKKRGYEELGHLTARMAFCQMTQQIMNWVDGMIRGGGAWDVLGTGMWPELEAEEPEVDE